jgi:predicted acetyltransferase
VEVRAPQTEEEWQEADAVFQRGFGLFVDTDAFERNLARQMRDRYLAVFLDGRVAAAAQVRPFGMFLGGRSVPMGGYSPVAVAPEFRGFGHGTRVTEAHFSHLRERGEVLAGLYPASTKLYRGVGFEVAGVLVQHSIFTRHLNQIRPTVAWPTERRLTDDDIPAIKACYRRTAQRNQGWLDRPDSWWDQAILENFAKEHWYGVDGDGGELAGYVRYRHARASPPYSYGITVNELCADDPDVAIGLWKLVGSSSSQGHTTKFLGGHEHPLLVLLPEQDAKVELDIRWMARVIDASAAVAARGFPAAVTGSVGLELRDPQCDWNAGSWTLTVEGGTGTLEKGGDGDVQLTINGFSSLFTGYATAETLRMAGLLSGGSPRDHDLLTAAFSTATPSIVDFY